MRKIGYTVLQLLLLLLFLVVITPAGLFLRLVMRGQLRRGRDGEMGTSWVVHRSNSGSQHYRLQH